MIGLCEVVARQVQVNGAEVLALKKLAIICGALADKIPASAAVEQRALTRVLVDVINQLEDIR